MLCMGSFAALLAQGASAAREKLRRLRGKEPSVKAVSKARVVRRRERKAIFASSTDLKERVKKLLDVKAYDVHDYYKTTGVCQKIARSHAFDVFTLLVVAANSVWIGVDLDFNRCPILAFAHPSFVIVEELFTFFFVFEWVVRFKAFKKKRQAFKDSWFVFDSALCFLMVLENWVLEVVLHLPGFDAVAAMSDGGILRIARLFRLLRIARMARLFHAFPELLILVRGMVAATRSVLTTLSLLAILLYVFALCFRQLTMDIPVLRETYFQSVPKTMYTLVIQGIFMDNLGLVVSHIGSYSPAAAALFWVFLLSSSLTVMNMLIAVICEAVSSVATTEKEAMQVSKVKRRITEMLEEMDHVDSKEGQVSKKEFLLMLENPEATQLFTEVGVDPIALVDHVDAMFVAEDVGGSEQTLDFSHFIELILSLRSSCRATVKDIIDLRKFTRTIVAQTNDHLSRIESKLDQLHVFDDEEAPARPQLRPAPAPEPAPAPAPPAAPAAPAPGGQKKELDPQKAAKIASMLARAKALGSNVKDGNVSSLASRAKELQSARDALRKVSEAEGR